MNELTLNCWVRSEDPEAIFQVKLSNTDTVYGLQKAIKNETSVTFRDVDPKAIALYKPKASISIPYERLRKIILSEHGELLYGVYRLSNVFPEPPPEYDIHVIFSILYALLSKFPPLVEARPVSVSVCLSGALTRHNFTATISPSSSVTSNIVHAARKRGHGDIASDEERSKRHKVDSSIVDDGPCYVNFGLNRLQYDGSPTDSILRFYEQFWGNPLPQGHISLKDPVYDPNDEENDDENDGDLLPANPPPIIDTDWRRLLIRAEYLRIYNWVEQMYEVGEPDRPSAVIFFDTPSCIRKSFWAYYALRRRLGDKSVCLWLRGSVFYLFCSEGVLVVPATFSGFNKFRPRIWTIIDSSQSPSGIPGALNVLLTGVFPIYLTPPRPARWSGLSQSWMPHRVIMNPWTRAEIEYAAKNLSLSNGIDDALQRYDLLGPTARFCLEMTPDEVATYIADRDASIASTCLDRFREHFSNGVEMSYDTFLHKICLIRRPRGSRLGFGGFTIELISAAVEQQVVQRLEKFSGGQLLDMWAKFSRLGNARGMTGSIFEAFIHRQFRTRIDLDATSMVRSNCVNSCWHASFSTKRPYDATVYGVAQQDFSLHVDVCSTFIYDSTSTLNIQPDVYYVPQSGQQVTLDSFILHGGYLNVFLCTGGRDRSIKDGLVRFLTSCSGLPPHTYWRFVFVVPDDFVSFYCPASSDSDLDVPV
ncbi:hypothetical protein BGW80DRAFT_1439868 [Lactifluus volemus]|nr:hypothetical protein BGW80DRAFT_1439868 [Lactifluus volemus]